MGRVLDLAGAHEGFVRVREDIVHVVTADERGRAEWDIHLLARAVVVAERLPAASGDRNGHEGGYAGRIEVVEGGVDVPAIESRVCKVILLVNRVFVKGLVVGVDEGDIFETLVRWNKPVSDDLHLRLVGDCLEIWVQDAAFGI